MLKSLEHNEHAGHIAHGGSAHGGGSHDGGHQAVAAEKSRVPAQMAALLVSVLAAGLAISEQGAKHAEIKVQASLIAATDAWAQYQAKSTRSTLSKDLMALITVLEPPSAPEVAERRKAVVDMLTADQQRYDTDPKDGREAIARRAHDFEHARDHALEQTHAYHNGAASMELGIVLTTASAIIGSRLLIRIGLGVGLVGVFCSLAGYFRPEWGAF